MKRIWMFSLIAIAALILAACAGQASRMVGGAGGAAPMMEAAPPAAPEEYAVSDAEAPVPGSGVNATTIQRLVIKNAEISIVVSDVEGRMKSIQVMAQQMGGYVVSSNTYQSYASENVYVPEGNLVIRVPAETLDKALEEIKKDVVEVKKETSSGEDVTAQYVDLQSRLKNLEAAEAQMEEIMKNATETEDVINVFNQLSAYREEIEVVKGQMKYYEESAALSSITVHVIAEAKEKPFEVGGWRVTGTARDALQSLVYFYQGFVRFLIWFVLFMLPVLITLCVPMYLVFLGGRFVYHKLRGKKVEPVQEPVEKK